MKIKRKYTVVAQQNDEFPIVFTMDTVAWDGNNKLFRSAMGWAMTRLRSGVGDSVTILSCDPAETCEEAEKRFAETCGGDEKQFAEVSERKQSSIEWFCAHEHELRQIRSPHREGETLWDQAVWFMNNTGEYRLTHLFNTCKLLLEIKNGQV